jgi:iron complex transport system substrate-binding protein
MKIASLIPSGTDIACSLGLGSHLVAISHECDHPAARGLPIVTRSVVDSSLPPAQIDADVNAAVEAGQSLYLTNRELLRELEPDVVLTQTICDVCAVNSQTARASLPPNSQLVNLSATSFEGLWQDLHNVAEATGTNAAPLVHELQARLEAVKHRAQARTTPRVLVLEWTDPPFLGGHWVPEMVELAGGTHIISGPGEASRRCTWDEIRAAHPEIIILAPCGYDLAQTQQQGRTIAEQLRSTGAREVWATNATAFFSRCTPASVDGVEMLEAIFAGNYEGKEAQPMQ